MQLVIEFIIPKLLMAEHVSSGTPLIIRSSKLYLHVGDRNTKKLHTQIQVHLSVILICFLHLISARNMQHTETVYVSKPNYRTFSTVKIRSTVVAPPSPIFTATVFMHRE